MSFDAKVRMLALDLARRNGTLTAVEKVEYHALVRAYNASKAGA